MKAIAEVKKIAEELVILSDEHTAFFNKVTGELLLFTQDELDAAEADDEEEEQEEEDDSPEWEGEAIEQAREVLSCDNFVALPSKYDIDEYSMMEDFCNSVKEDRIRTDLLRQIRGGGAFRRFKDSLHHHGITESWYQFRDQALEKIAIEWLKENDILYTLYKRKERNP